MIGDKLLEKKQKHMTEAESLLKEFGFASDSSDGAVDVINARRLVKLNNEVYYEIERLRNKTKPIQ